MQHWTYQKLSEKIEIIGAIYSYQCKVEAVGEKLKLSVQKRHYKWINIVSDKIKSEWISLERL